MTTPGRGSLVAARVLGRLVVGRVCVWAFERKEERWREADGRFALKPVRKYCNSNRAATSLSDKAPVGSLEAH